MQQHAVCLSSNAGAQGQPLRPVIVRQARLQVSCVHRPQSRPLPPPQAASTLLPAPAGVLVSDEELLGALRPLLGPVCQQMASAMQRWRGAGSGQAAAIALRSLEQAGAIPHLDRRQREILRGALARSAAAMQTGDEERLDPGELSDLEEDGAVFSSITPLAREVYRTMMSQ